MKILIADDCPNRYGRLEESLKEKGLFSSVDISYASSAWQARDSLEQSYFDLLILDILLPNRASQDAESANYSMDLLNELSDESELIRPAYILGITGDPDTYQESESYFLENTWTIVNYSHSNVEWITRIINCVKYILIHKDSTKYAPIEYDYDLLVICALADPELSELLKINWNWEPARPVDSMTFVSDGTFECKGQRYKVAAAAADRMGMVETALLSAKLISKLKPKCIAMIGICAGVPGKIELGDIIFADPVWDYQSGKLTVNEDGNNIFEIEPHQIPCNQGIRALVKQAINKEALQSIYCGFPNPPTPLPTFRVGPVGSGSAVLADGEKIQDILNQNRKMLGVEMELYGMFAASQKTELNPSVFAIKSVCDFASPDKGDEIQQYCAYLSAQSLKVLVESFGDKIFT